MILLQPFGALVLQTDCSVELVVKGLTIHCLTCLAFHPQNTVCGHVGLNQRLPNFFQCGNPIHLPSLPERKRSPDNPNRYREALRAVMIQALGLVEELEGLFLLKRQSIAQMEQTEAVSQRKPCSAQESAMKQLTVHYCGWRVADETDPGRLCATGTDGWIDSFAGCWKKTKEMRVLDLDSGVLPESGGDCLPCGLSGSYFAICLSRISSSVLQSMQSDAVGLASSRFRPISIPHFSQ